MNSKAIYIFPFYTFYAEELYKNFNEFKKEDVIFLATTLYLNILENLIGKEDKIDIYCIWDRVKKIDFRMN